MKLTIIIRDDSPMVFCGDSPSYRSVVVELTKEQVERIELKKVGTSGRTEYYEQISKCFIEEVKQP